MTQQIRGLKRHIVPRLWEYLSGRRRLQLVTAFTLTLIASTMEVLSIGAVVPFLTVMATPEKALSLEATAPVIRWLGITSADELRLPLTLIFCFGVIIASSTRLTLTWFQARLAGAIGADLSGRVYQRTLYQPYTVHIARNSSEIHAGLSKSQGLVNSVILPTLSLVSSTFMLLSILGFLIWIDPVSAAAAFGGIGSIYGCVTWAARTRLQNNSRVSASSHTGIAKAAIEGLGGIRDILLDGLQPFFLKLFKQWSIPLARAQASNQVLFQTPRLAVEGLSIVSIAGLAYLLSTSSDGLYGSIPTLGALALGAQRMLPMVQNIYQSVAAVRGNQQNIADALELLEQPMPHDPNTIAQSEPIDFKSEIRLESVSFRYTPSSPLVLNDLNLTIARGSRVGFIGETGSGKSTLLDILMGLLEPTAGTVKIDDVTVNSYALRRSWQAHIAHVPQVIFLTDDSIAANVAFGIERRLVDMARVADAARRAQIATTIDGLADRYNTRIGERGVRLSGGQRQRIGIARALYKQADVLIFDEATSALDNTTEAEVMRAIDALDKDLTILMVAHRLTTLRGCDTIVELKSGKVARIGTYDEIIGASSLQA